MEKYGTAGQATVDNMAHALCMLDTKGYRHTQYVTLIAFPWQQWLRASVLRCTYFASLIVWNNTR